MLLLTATQQPDYIALALAVLLFLVIGILAIRKHLTLKRAARTQDEAPAQSAPAADAPRAPGTAGQIKLHDVEPKTAAMIMAIVANKMDKPLNELRFISIKEVK